MTLLIRFDFIHKIDQATDLANFDAATPQDYGGD